MSDRLPRVWFNKSFSSIGGVLRQLEQSGLFLVCSHTDPHFPPLATCSHFEIEPANISGADYVEWCMKFCSRNGIDVFVPGRMGDLIADHAEDFLKRGVRLITAADGKTMRLLENKAEFLERVPKEVAVHRFYRVHTWSQFAEACEHLERDGLPVCFKPATGTYGIGFHVIDNRMTPIKRLLRSEAHYISKHELATILSAVESFPELLVMEYLSGNEFSVDALARKGEVVAMVCRRKLSKSETNSSRNSRAAMVRPQSLQVLAIEPVIERMVRILSAHFKLCGIFNVQFRAAGGGDECPYLLEINGRISGGLPYVGLSGLNLTALAIQIALRDTVAPLPEIESPRLPLLVGTRPEFFVATDML